jgi:hypothetical protein
LGIGRAEVPKGAVEALKPAAELLHAPLMRVGMPCAP